MQSDKATRNLTYTIIAIIITAVLLTVYIHWAEGKVKKSECKHKYQVVTEYRPIGDGMGSHKVDRKRICIKCKKEDESYKNDWYPYVKIDPCKGKLLSTDDLFLTYECEICGGKYTIVNTKAKKEEYVSEEKLFKYPAGCEFEHAYIKGTIMEEPEDKGDYYFAKIETDKGNVAMVVIEKGNTKFQYGDYVYVTGEVSGQTKYKGKYIPIIDDTDVKMGVEYEHVEE